MASKAEAVKKFYEQTDTYLQQDYNIRLRAEVLRDFLGKDQYPSVIDIPCGNGAVSVPLLGHFEKLTLVDFAVNMISEARASIPESQLGKVTFVNTDIFTAEVTPGSFDLVISLGILAHIDDPGKLVKRISSLVKPGGKLMIQNTDSGHSKAKLTHSYTGLKQLSGKQKYKMNRVENAWLQTVIEQAGFRMVSEFRYNQSFLGFSRFYSNNKKYQLIRKRYGTAANNTNPQKGAETLFLFQKTG